MQNWLHDNFALISMLLSIAAGVLLYAWWKTRRPMYALGAGAAVAFMGLIWLLLYLLPFLFGESDGQQIERKVRDMAAAVKARDVNRIFSHISEEFRFGSHDKATFRRRAEDVIRSRDVEEVIVWDFERGEI